MTHCGGIQTHAALVRRMSRRRLSVVILAANVDDTAQFYTTTATATSASATAAATAHVSGDIANLLYHQNPQELQPFLGKATTNSGNCTR